MKSSVELLPRWNLDLRNINKFLDRILSDVNFPQNKRGRPYKREPRVYIRLIILKEFFSCSLRKAESLGGIDHSVIHFWEKKLSKNFIENLVKQISKSLDMDYDFSFLDSTVFSTWRNQGIEVHTLARICRETVYPVSIYFGKVSPAKAVSRVTIQGNGFILADRWYDVNDVFRTIYRKGYIPLIKPQRTRGRGYWRRKGRGVYSREWRMYRQRGRGESVFGSLTNEFGDRLKTVLWETSVTRIGCRFVVYLVKLLMRKELRRFDWGLVIIWNY